MRIALLTNFVAPYRVPLFRALAAKTDALRILVSTGMEANRAWDVDWSGLDVVQQRNFTVARRWRHPAGFEEPNYLHVPYDTVPALARFRPDVVISGELGARTLQSVAWGKYLARKPVLVWATLSERLEQGRGREGVRGWLLKRAAGVLVNGESGARYIQRFGVPDARIFRLPQPVDVARFAAAPLERPAAAAHRLLCVGNLTELKGPRQLFDGLERLGRARPERQIELTLVGEGPLRGELEARALPGNVRVSFRGHVAYEQLPPIYAEHGILVFPSLADEWGLVVNEALASGLPVLGSVHAQAVEELVEEGRTGWWFDPERPESLDVALARALDTPAEALASMRGPGRERARAHDPEDGARRMLEAADAVA